MGINFLFFLQSCISLKNGQDLSGEQRLNNFSEDQEKEVQWFVFETRVRTIVKDLLEPTIQKYFVELVTFRQRELKANLELVNEQIIANKKRADDNAVLLTRMKKNDTLLADLKKVIEDLDSEKQIFESKCNVQFSNMKQHLDLLREKIRVQGEFSDQHERLQKNQGFEFRKSQDLFGEFKDRVEQSFTNLAQEVKNSEMNLRISFDRSETVRANQHKKIEELQNKVQSALQTIENQKETYLVSLQKQKLKHKKLKGTFKEFVNQINFAFEKNFVDNEDLNRALKDFEMRNENRLRQQAWLSQIESVHQVTKTFFYLYSQDGYSDPDLLQLIQKFQKKQIKHIQKRAQEHPDGIKLPLTDTSLSHAHNTSHYERQAKTSKAEKQRVKKEVQNSYHLNEGTKTEKQKDRHSLNFTNQIFSQQLSTSNLRIKVVQSQDQAVSSSEQNSPLKEFGQDSKEEFIQEGMNILKKRMTMLYKPKEDYNLDYQSQDRQSSKEAFEQNNMQKSLYSQMGKILERMKKPYHENASQEDVVKSQKPRSKTTEEQHALAHFQEVKSQNLTIEENDKNEEKKGKTQIEENEKNKSEDNQNINNDKILEEEIPTDLSVTQKEDSKQENWSPHNNQIAASEQISTHGLNLIVDSGKVKSMKVSDKQKLDEVEDQEEELENNLEGEEESESSDSSSDSSEEEEEEQEEKGNSEDQSKRDAKLQKIVKKNKKTNKIKQIQLFKHYNPQLAGREKKIDSELIKQMLDEWAADNLDSQIQDIKFQFESILKEEVTRIAEIVNTSLIKNEEVIGGLQKNLDTATVDFREKLDAVKSQVGQSFESFIEQVEAEIAKRNRFKSDLMIDKEKISKELENLSAGNLQVLVLTQRILENLKLLLCEEDVQPLAKFHDQIVTNLSLQDKVAEENQSLQNFENSTKERIRVMTEELMSSSNKNYLNIKVDDNLQITDKYISKRKEREKYLKQAQLASQQTKRSRQPNFDPYHSHSVSSQKRITTASQMGRTRFPSLKYSQKSDRGIDATLNSSARKEPEEERRPGTQLQYVERSFFQQNYERNRSKKDQMAYSGFE